MSVKELLEKGVNLFQNEEFEHAKHALNSALELDKENLDVLNFLGLTHIHLDDPKQALEYFGRAVVIDEDDEIVWNNMGDAHAILDENEKALSCFEKALTINVSYGNAYFNKGLVLADLGRFEEAHECFSKAIEFNEDQEKVDAYYEQALVYIEEERFNEALENIDLAEGLMESAELTNLRATCYDHLERYEEALKLYESVESKAEEDELLADIYYNKSFTLISLDRKEDAVKNLIQAVKLLPEIKEDVIDNELLMELNGIGDFNTYFAN